MAHIVALANQKGGVGKTTTAVNLGAALAQAGRRILVVDVDSQANATSHLGYDKRTVETSIYDVLVRERPVAEVAVTTTRLGLDLVPSSPDLAGAEVEMVRMMRRERMLRRGLEAVRAHYDYVLIDPPPSLGLLTINALTAADSVVIPVQAEYLALEGLSQLVSTIERVRERLNPSLHVLGLLLTMYDRRTNLAAEVEADLRQHFSSLVFQTVVPRSIRLSEAPSFGETIFEYDARSAGAEAYAHFADELQRRMVPEPQSS